MSRRLAAFFMITIFVFGLTADVWAKKFDLKNLGEDLLKAAAGGAVIRQIAGPLNDFLNSLMLAHHAENRDFTKVVPIFSVGNQAAIGAAQVSGPEELVNDVRAVFCLEGTFGNIYRAKCYVPNKSSNPLNLERVYGVGVTAVIEGFL
ncbi:MAG: hypothetical protein PHW04_17745 [Candidatus Wallbacteria bacterium]|nr:hypothetical protein [Candidatus Wallbacteria bacterium]